MEAPFIPPRVTPSRAEKYMGLAWMHAAFSKDPRTQVGAQIVGPDNMPWGSGYNGPPSIVPDDSFSWSPPPEDDPDEFSKYDVMDHAEINAIDHSCTNDFTGATLYVTALPCPPCMRAIMRKRIMHVVYMDFQSVSGSSLKNAKWRDKSLKLAEMAGINLEKFSGNLNWVRDWTLKMQELKVFEMK